MDKVIDDPQRRRPDISVAKKHLNWSPKVKLSEGLDRTIDYFRNELNKVNQQGQQSATAASSGTKDTDRTEL